VHVFSFLWEMGEVLKQAHEDSNFYPLLFSSSTKITRPIMWQSWLARRGQQTWVWDFNENGINGKWMENKETPVLPFHPVGLSI
jgi:hypothetical protein